MVYKRYAMSGNSMLTGLQSTTTQKTFAMGLGHQSEIVPKLNFLKHIGAYTNTVTDGNDFIPVSQMPAIFKGYTQYTMPANLALEWECYEWLLFRGSTGMNLINFADYDDTKPGASTFKSNLKSIPEFRMGATYKTKGVGVEVAMGTGNLVRNGKTAGDNTGLENQFFAMLGLNYAWTEFGTVE